MKKMHVFKGLLVLSCMAFWFISCEKDEDPSYAGTWIQTETEDGISYRDKIVLSSSSFENYYSMKVGDLTDWIDLAGMKGSLSVSSNVFTVTLKSVGMADIDTTTYEISDMVWYESGSDEFNDFVAESGGSTMKAEFSVSGNSLTIVPDSDGDGDFDSDETMVYTKQ